MRRLRRTIITFTAVSLFVLVAGIIYTINGRGVTSPYMSFAFLYSLLMGVALNLLLLPVQKRLPFVGTQGYRLYSNLYNSGIATLTVYSVLMGILDIADNYSKLMIFLLLAGVAASVAGLIVLFVLLSKVRQALRIRQKHQVQQRIRSK